jgi:adenosine kinase
VPDLPSALTTGQVIVTGSLAFDNIMDFPGYFKDHILPEKVHVINISFLVDKMTRQRGGCAANIAYTEALLGGDPRIVAAAGSDFADYRQWLIEQGVDVAGIHDYDDEITACCYITTDRSDCQITGFYVGAMKHARELSLRQEAGDRAALCFVSPDDPEAMMRHCEEARQMGLPFMFDPSFQVTAMEGDALATASAGAWALVVNDYEFTVLREKTGKSAETLRAEHELIVVTYGEKGSEILCRDGSDLKIPAATATQVVDPTGAGDAFRGGLLAGLQRGYELGAAARMGSVAAVYCVEQYGTQNHRYTEQEFFDRYRACFGSAPED